MSPKIPAKVFRKLRMVSSLSSGPFSDFSASACDSLRKRAGPEDLDAGPPVKVGDAAAISEADV